MKLQMIDLFFIFCCACIAFSLSAICGGGAGLMLIPVLGWQLPTAQIPAALSIGTFSSSASRLIVFYKQIRWTIVRWFVPAAIPAVGIGAYLLRYINPLYIQIIMGLFLVSNLIALVRKQNTARPQENNSHKSLLIIGFLAGFLSGFTGAVGLLFNRFYLKYGLSKEEIVATRAANEIVLHLIRLVLYGLFGLLTVQVLQIGAVVMVAAIFSSVGMKWLLPLLSEFYFRKIGYLAMVVSGFAMVGYSGNALLAQKGGSFTFRPVSKGILSEVQWQQSHLTLEFEYDEGFEYEVRIPFSELPAAKQKWVQAQNSDYDTIVIEQVFSRNKTSYEAYYFKAGKLIRKLDF